MGIRFSTEAANADVLGEDKDSGNPNEGTPERAAGDGKSPDRAAGSLEGKRGRSDDGEAKPGKDINAAGFIKDKDAAKP